MNNRIYILTFFILLTASLSAPALAETSAQDRERKVKAAFLYNFINFVDWPEEKVPDNDDPVIIGIVCEKSIAAAFDPIKNKKIGGKGIQIQYFRNLDLAGETTNNPKQKKFIEQLQKCHVLFICSCEPKPTDNYKTIINRLKTLPVLIVGEQEGFLEIGGNIRFLVEQKKVRFEINLDSTKQKNLKIRSKLLKLSKRVIHKESDKQEQDIKNPGANTPSNNEKVT